MLTCSTIRTKYSWQNDWSQGFRLCDPRRVTILWHLCQSTLSKPRLIQWVWIHVCCSTNSLLLSTDVLKYEPCVYPPALFETTGTMLQSDKQMPYRDEYHLQVLKSPRMSATSMMAMLWSAKFHIEIGRFMSLYWNYTEYVKKEIWPTNVLFDGYPGDPSTKDNFHLRWNKSSGSNSSYSKEAT